MGGDEISCSIFAFKFIRNILDQVINPGPGKYCSIIYHLSNGLNRKYQLEKKTALNEHLLDMMGRRLTRSDNPPTTLCLASMGDKSVV